MKHIRAVEDGEAEVGFLPAPLHRCAHALFAVIPDAEFSALERPATGGGKHPPLGGRIHFELGRVSSGACLTIDLKSWQRGRLRACREVRRVLSESCFSWD